MSNQKSPYRLEAELSQNTVSPSTGCCVILKSFIKFVIQQKNYRPSYFGSIFMLN